MRCLELEDANNPKAALNRGVDLSVDESVGKTANHLRRHQVSGLRSGVASMSNASACGWTLSASVRVQPEVSEENLSLKCFLDMWGHISKELLVVEGMFQVLSGFKPLDVDPRGKAGLMCAVGPWSLLKDRSQRCEVIIPLLGAALHAR